MGDLKLDEGMIKLGDPQRDLRPVFYLEQKTLGLNGSMAHLDIFVFDGGKR